MKKETKEKEKKKKKTTKKKKVEKVEKTEVIKKEIEIEKKEENQEIKKINVMKFSELSDEEKEDLESKYKKIRKRIFNISQYVKHPETGESIIDEERIKLALEDFGKCRYAYILHDKDTKEDGTEKPPHFHIVIQTENPVSLIVVAKRFDILPNYIEFPKGRNAFGDCCEYLTHENERQQEKGKYLYSDEEIKANFDFRALINETIEKRLNAELRGEMTEKTFYFSKVRNGEMSLTDVLKEDINFYYDHERELKYFRSVYLQEVAEMPAVRLNFYVYGEGGAGKDVMSRALARSLYPDEKDDNKIFFTVGNDNVMFDGYDGQPVIIWSDFRAEELLRTFNYKRGIVFKIFDTHPIRFNLNVKYSKVNLINKYNIVNSVQNYKLFLDGLSGEYMDREMNEHKAEDKKQSYRRFPVIIPIRTDDFDIMINKGFIGEGSYEEYNEIKGVFANLRAIEQIPDREERRKIQTQTLSIACNEIKKIETKDLEKENNYDFKNFGKTKEQIRNERKVADEPKYDYAGKLVEVEEAEEIDDDDDKFPF